MDRVDLNLLRSFVSIYETGSLTRSARDLQVTQPSVSHALARLRRQFDDPLFVRGKHGMAPTALAGDLYLSFQEALARIDRTIESTRQFHPETSERRFRLCLTDVGEMALLPFILEHIGREAPAVELEAVPMQIDRVAEWLNTGRLDAAIVSAPMAGTLRSELVQTDTYACLVGDQFPLVDGRMTMADFLAARHVVTSPDSGHRPAEQTLEDLRLERKATVTVRHFSVLPHLVARCGLVGFVPRNAAGAITAGWPLKVVPPPFEVPTFEVRLWWRAGGDRDTAAQVWFRRAVLTALRAPHGPPNASAPDRTAAETPALDSAGPGALAVAGAPGTSAQKG